MQEPHQVTDNIVSAMIRIDIFDFPSVRSRKTMGSR